MYHAVMEEVVRFLDRCHHTLSAQTTTTTTTGKSSVAGGGGNGKLSAMARSKSVNQVFVPNDTSSLLNEPIRGSNGGGGGASSAGARQRPSGGNKLSLTQMMNSLDENFDISALATTTTTTTGRTSESSFANYKDLTWYVD